MTKCNEDETENAVSDGVKSPLFQGRYLCSILLYFPHWSGKILVVDDENTPVISEDSISNQYEVIIKPVHTENVKYIRVQLMS